MFANFEACAQSLVKGYVKSQNAMGERGKLRVQRSNATVAPVRLGSVNLIDDIGTEVTVFIMLNVREGTIFLSNGVNKLGNDAPFIWEEK